MIPLQDDCVRCQETLLRRRLNKKSWRHYLNKAKAFLIKKKTVSAYTKDLETKLTHERELNKQLRKFNNQLADKISELSLAIQTNKHIKTKAVMRPTKAVMARIKKGKVCSACYTELNE